MTDTGFDLQNPDPGPQPPTHELDATKGPALFYLGSDETLYRLDNGMLAEDGRIELAGGAREDAICRALLDLVRPRFDQTGHQ